MSSYINKTRILVVEDSPDQLAWYKDILESSMICHFSTECEHAQSVLDDETIDVVLTDIHLTESKHQSSFEGFNIIEYAKAYHPEILVLAMSADPKLSTYKKAHELGADHWVKKPILELDEILIAIEHAKTIRRSKSEPTLKTCESGFEDGLVLDAEIRMYVNGIAKKQNVACVINGETGTGKEEVAKLIHKMRVENEGSIPFVAANCSDLNSSIASSVLFGHRKGSFTGADKTTTGFVGEANGGILFLDEIHRLDKESQAKLLRVLNDGSYQRFGDSKTLFSQFQVIAASSQNLDQLVEEGDFLMDLRSRLTGIDLQLRPLRERTDDMEPLVRLFFKKEKEEISDEMICKVVEKCKSYYWQGNIRQLFNVLRSFHTICSLNDSDLDMKYFPEYKTMLAPGIQNISQVDTFIQEGLSLKTLVENLEKSAIAQAIKNNKTKTEAAQSLKMNRGTFDKRVSKYNLD